MDGSGRKTPRRRQNPTLSRGEDGAHIGMAASKTGLTAIAAPADEVARNRSECEQDQYIGFERGSVGSEGGGGEWAYFQERCGLRKGSRLAGPGTRGMQDQGESDAGERPAQEPWDPR